MISEGTFIAFGDQINRQASPTPNCQRAFSFKLANQLITSVTNNYQYDGYNRRVKNTSLASRVPLQNLSL